MSDASYYFPGQLFQNPDGSFNLNITGHVHAAGLDLDAGTTGVPPDQDRIRWIKQSDGSVVANIAGFSSGGVQEVDVTSRANAPANTSLVFLVANDDLGATQAAFNIQQANRGASAMAHLDIAGFAKILLNQSEQSDYMQLSALSNIKVQLGIAAVSLGVGLNGFNVALSNPWSNTHQGVIASAFPASVATPSDYLATAGPNGLANAFIRVNSSAAQSWTIQWLSIGT